MLRPETPARAARPRPGRSDGSERIRVGVVVGGREQLGGVAFRELDPALDATAVTDLFLEMARYESG